VGFCSKRAQSVSGKTGGWTPGSNLDATRRGVAARRILETGRIFRSWS
jgi:hypothetical protein